MAPLGLMVFWSRKVGEVEAKRWLFLSYAIINVGLKSLQFPGSLKYNFLIRKPSFDFADRPDSDF